MFDNNILSKKLARKLEPTEVESVRGAAQWIKTYGGGTCLTNGGGDDYTSKDDFVVN